jgi:hypothetical protein
MDVPCQKCGALYTFEITETPTPETTKEIDAPTALTEYLVELPEGTRALVDVRGHIAAVTDEPPFVMPAIGADFVEFVEPGLYMKGVGYGSSIGESLRLAVADYLAKKETGT